MFIFGRMMLTSRAINCFFVHKLHSYVAGHWNNLFQVRLLTVPVTLILFSFWKAATASAVAFPYTPSTATSRFSCTCCTILPRSPTTISFVGAGSGEGSGLGGGG